MRLIILSKASKQLEKFTKLKQIIVGQKIRTLVGSELLTNSKPLGGYKNVWRARVGDYQIVYKRNTDEVVVILLAHRKEVYHLLEQMLK